MNIYYDIYDVIEYYICGGDAMSTPELHLAVVLVSLIATLFIIALPFLVVWRAIKMIAG